MKYFAVRPSINDIPIAKLYIDREIINNHTEKEISVYINKFCDLVNPNIKHRVRLAAKTFICNLEKEYKLELEIKSDCYIITYIKFDDKLDVIECDKFDYQ